MSRPAPSTPAPSTSALAAREITKTYGGVQALRRVTFEARRGAVNVVVGENGAGKSTLMKILSGAEQPTEGRIELDGQEVSLRSPRDAMALGIGIIHQELSLFPNLSMAENIFAGRELRGRTPWVNKAAQRRVTREVLQQLNQDIAADTLVGALPLGKQQLVEIAKVLAQDVKILIMDEPTSALSNTEVDDLFAVIRGLISRDVTVIYISHKLDEFRRIGDYVTVLRDGQKVAQAPMGETETGWIVENMVGRTEKSLFSRHGGTVGAELLAVEGLTVPGPVAPLVDDVSLRVRTGEIVGIYGLMGAGRTELLEALIGARPHTARRITLSGQVVSPEESIADRLRRGLALVPEDRQRDGLVQVLSVSANIVLATLGALVRGVLLAPERERRVAAQQVSSLAIRIPGLDAPVTSLSGGNQQKVVLARALLTKPTVLLLDEPTRGVDVGAKTEIFRLVSELADSGLGVLFVSSELTEVLAMSDRILVMAQGRVTAELSAATATEQELIAASAASTPDDPATTAKVI